MYIKDLRQKKHISQEQLAENCGLSLRTIQRVEAGHRVGYASLRTLATEFGIDIDEFEQEIYSMDKISDELGNYPRIVKFMFGSGDWNTVNRRHELIKIEIVLFSLFVVFVTLGLCALNWDLASSPNQFLQGIGEGKNVWIILGVLELSGAYLVSKQISIGDRYDIWSRLDPTQRYTIFGAFLNRAKN